MATQVPDLEWSAHARCLLGVATEVVYQGLDLAIACSARASQQQGDSAGGRPMDLHSCNLLLPLLHYSLEALWYAELSAGQKRLAWHAVQKLSAGIIAGLSRPPAEWSEMLTVYTPMAQRERVRYAQCQPLLHVTACESRLDGSAGSLTPALQAISRARNEAQSTEEGLDTYSEVALPWDPTPGDTFERLLGEVPRAIQGAPQLVELKPRLMLLLSPLKDAATTADGLQDAAERLLESMMHASYLLLPLLQLSEASTACRDARTAEADGRLLLAEAEEAVAELRARDLVKMRELTQVLDAEDAAERGLLSAALEARVEEAHFYHALVHAVEQMPTNASTAADVVAKRANEVLAESRALGARAYARGQRLSVLAEDGWHDMIVAKDAAGLIHELVTDGSPPRHRDCSPQYAAEARSVLLHPWNHGPRTVSATAFEELLRRYKHALGAQHGSFREALSSRRLDVLKQAHTALLVRVRSGSPMIAESASARRRAMALSSRSSSTVPPSRSTTPVSTQTDLSRPGSTRTNLSRPASTRTASGQPDGPAARTNQVDGAAALYSQLRHAHVRRCSGDAATSVGVLVVGPPGSGKSLLVSQTVMQAIRDPTPQALVPIVVRVATLQQRLQSSHRATFARAWNYVDAYLQCEHGTQSDMYLMLRQAMLSRRALIVLDGVDEGAASHEDIERHITQVLASQGNALFVTARLGALWEGSARYHYFDALRVMPLNTDQQQLMIERRIGKGGSAAKLQAHIKDAVPLDAATGLSLAASPLWLSMLITVFDGIFDDSAGSGCLHSRTSDLYAAAFAAVLASCTRLEHGPAAASAMRFQLDAILQVAFFHAHIAMESTIDSASLEAAALSLAKAESPSHDGACAQGLEPVRSAVPLSGLHLTALYTIMRYAATERLPLLTVLYASPNLQLQAAHHTYQEYYVARALCDGMPLPADLAPWQW